MEGRCGDPGRKSLFDNASWSKFSSLLLCFALYYCEHLIHQNVFFVPEKWGKKKYEAKQKFQQRSGNAFVIPILKQSTLPVSRFPNRLSPAAFFSFAAGQCLFFPSKEMINRPGWQQRTRINFPRLFYFGRARGRERFFPVTTQWLLRKSYPNLYGSGSETSMQRKSWVSCCTIDLPPV